MNERKYVTAFGVLVYIWIFPKEVLKLQNDELDGKAEHLNPFLVFVLCQVKLPLD